MRTIYATLTIKLVVKADEDLNFGQFCENLSIAPECQDPALRRKADIETADIEQIDVTDSK